MTQDPKHVANMEQIYEVALLLAQGYVRYHQKELDMGGNLSVYGDRKEQNA